MSAPMGSGSAGARGGSFDGFRPQGRERARGSEALDRAPSRHLVLRTPYSGDCSAGAGFGPRRDSRREFACDRVEMEDMLEVRKEDIKGATV